MSKDEITCTVDELAGKDGVTNDDITAAQRLARKWLYEGNEPYASALYSIAAMLAEHRRNLATSVEQLRAELHQANDTIADLRARLKLSGFPSPVTDD
jgi:hypothetical protein